MPSIQPLPRSERGGACTEAEASHLGFAEYADAVLWKAYHTLLGRPDAGEPEAFAPLIEWGMRLLKDDELLRHSFSVSRITLKRWAASDTVPGPMARDAVIRRLEKIAADRIPKELQ